MKGGGGWGRQETGLNTAHLTCSSLHHPNLVSLIGISLNENPIYLITEFMAKVRQLLMEGRDCMCEGMVCGGM